MLTQNNEEDDVQITNFSQVIATVFVTLVMIGLYIKIIFF
jgi:hypothetical protein